MRRTQTVPSPEELELLSQVVRDVARGRRLSREDAQDFAQSVHLRCLERNYDIFMKFQGRSSLKTYLTIVVRRILLDWRNNQYGKWRPSAVAQGLGDHATRLERLIVRDGHTTSEAVEILSVRADAPPKSALNQMASQLPARIRPRMVSEAALQKTGSDFEDPVDEHERRTAYQAMRAALRTALHQLSPEDRRLIDARYRQDRSVQAVARTLRTDPKRLYREYERVLRSLRLTIVEGRSSHRPVARACMRPPF